MKEKRDMKRQEKANDDYVRYIVHWLVSWLPALQNPGRQVPYDAGHQSQQMPPPQQQHQKSEQRQGAGLGYSQHYTVSTLLTMCAISLELSCKILSNSIAYTWK